MRAWPVLSSAHGLLCLDTTRHRIVVRASPCTPSPVVCVRAFCRGQLCRNLKILYRDRNSPYPGQLYRDIELLCRNIISSCLGQLCRDIKILGRDKNLSSLANYVATQNLSFGHILPQHKNPAQGQTLS